MKTHCVGNVFLVLLLLLVSSGSFAQRGKDGVKTILSLNTIVNEFTTLTNDANAGSISLSVSASTLNSSGVFSSSLSAGDLIMIIQMQGATIKISSDTTYGQVLDYGNCGNYELCEVNGLAGSSILISCPLEHDYSAAGKVQVVRVPRYAALTVNSGAGITCPAWNGSTGGVVAIEVLNSTILNGTAKIDASGKGFRGAALNENLSSYGVNNFHWPTGDLGAEKGEGIAGFETEYDSLGGRYCRGASANAGGGGNAHNAGGGGGANGGDIALWTGRGCPDISNPNYITAWNLEYYGFASLISSGGGRGGYTFSSSNQNALVVGPNNTAWGGDKRDYNGGLGGRPLDYSTGKVFIGGGGGAGDQNDNSGGGGGNGGGLIFLVSYGTVSGSGQLLANGANGLNTIGSNGKDGAGGGGGGGTVIVNSSGAISGISAMANGGAGGNQTVSLFNQEAEGPGAGGGGGYIAISNGSISRTTAGGNNGTTNSISLTEFPPNGATKGGHGTDNATVNNFQFTLNDVTICAGSSATLTVAVAGIAPPGITFNWYSSATGGTTLGTGLTFATPPLASAATYYVGACPGTYRKAVHVNVDSVQATFTNTSACLGTATVFSGNASSSLGSVTGWNWDFGDGSGNSSLQNPVHGFSVAGIFPVTFTVLDNSGCSATVTDTILVSVPPVVAFTTGDTAGCGQILSAFTNNTMNGIGFSWTFGDGAASTQSNPFHLYNTPGSFTITLTSTSASGCGAVDSAVQLVTVYPLPAAAFTAMPICLNDTVRFTNASTVTGGAVMNYLWDFGDTTAGSMLTNPLHHYQHAGTYQAMLIANAGAGCADTATQAVTIHELPDVNFTASSQSACDSLSVGFTNTSPAAATFLWHFGDGTSSGQFSPVHFYAAHGVYTVSLTATGATGCSQTRSVIDMITIHDSPVINFSASLTTICEGQCIGFADSSTGTVSDWTWAFPGASPPSSLSQDPSNVCFPSQGNYPVTLTASNNYCSATQTMNNFINVLNCSQPVASFISSDTTVCAGSCLTFVSLSSNVSSWHWEFPGALPAVSADANPAGICYHNAGNFDVRLIASNPLTGDTLFLPGFIHVLATPQVPVILVSVDTLMAPQASWYQWYYDSIAISGANSSWNIASLPGYYSVEITDSNGCSAVSVPYFFSIADIVAPDRTISLSIYPNPADDFLNIRFDRPFTGELKITLLSVLGETIAVTNFQSDNKSTYVSLNVNKLAPGLYFFSVETSKNRVLQKFIKK